MYKRAKRDRREPPGTKQYFYYGRKLPTNNIYEKRNYLQHEGKKFKILKKLTQTG